jgi:phosphohistidine phosphatase
MENAVQLLIIRHAIAEDREEYARSGESDDGRPLTAFGKQRMVRNTRGLRRVAPAIDLLATSPLARAVQTARIVGDAYGIKEVAVCEAMRPDRPMKDFARWLGRNRQHDVVAVVGHDPHVSILATWLLTGLEEPRVRFKKGGALMLEMLDRPAGGAVLLWAIAPAQLRRLGE